jgi:heat shock protein HslJ
MNKYFFLLVLIFSLVACTASRNDTQVIERLSLFDTTWNLVEINQKPINTATATKKPRIQFSKKEMKATGNNGCNSFFANFDTVEDRLSFGPVGSTRMACQNWMENEMAFLAMLQSAKRYTIEDYTLLILDGNGQEIGKFLAAD